MDERLRYLPTCELLNLLASCFMDQVDPNVPGAALAAAQARWPKITRELSRRERRAIWRSCGCAVCEAMRGPDFVGT